MPKIVIVGGKLQGTEAAYLGKKAGFEMVLIDADPKAPAQKLCDKFICGDILMDDPAIMRELDSADMLLPTMENDAVLERLAYLSEQHSYVLAFDPAAYSISSSKRRSDQLFAQRHIPCPRYYPEGKLPYIAKLDSESGSHGLRYFAEQAEFDAFAAANRDKYIIQEYLDGPSYSMEIIGKPGRYRTYEVTQIFVDEGYDCNLAAAYRTLEPEKKHQMEAAVLEIADAVQLHGIMDLEVVDHNGVMKVLEVDARLPSQTSIAVYHATGMNYIRELYDLFCRGGFQSEQADRGRFCSFGHYLVEDGTITSPGEHIMAEGGLLDYKRDITDAAEVLTDYEEGSNVWRCTFISEADTQEALKEKECKARRDLERFVSQQSAGMDSVCV